ncbi:hypothetical protein BDV59DRAFT_211587 [Aspergillus ambiguus]|uniref:uncharacterized protein n=1 Tax=Aspergillus ambiguus TaxID=176160 RepID=UPI003CCD64DF
MKLPREMIDRILFFTPTLPRGALLSTLGLKPRNLDGQQILLWSTIFKDDQWLKKVTEEEKARLVLIGPQLNQVACNEQGTYGSNYMILCLLDGTGNIPAWEVSKSSLHQHTYDPSSKEIRFTSGIRLNVHNLSDPYLTALRKEAQLRNNPSLIISDERMKEVVSFHKGKPRTQYSFYGKGYIQDLSASNIINAERIWTFELRDHDVISTVLLTSRLHSFRHVIGID